MSYTRNGLAGLVLTDENADRRKRIISISQSGKGEMFEQTKKDDRLAAGYTMEQYERAYWQAFLDAARKADPKWEIGKSIMH